MTNDSIFKELSVRANLLEGRVSIDTMMTLDKFIACGKVENRLLYTILASMLESIRIGNLSPIDKDYNAVQLPVTVINKLRSVPAEQLVPFAIQCREILAARNGGFGVAGNSSEDNKLWLDTVQQHCPSEQAKFWLDQYYYAQE
jgi:hypothetical protein